MMQFHEDFLGSDMVVHMRSRRSGLSQPAPYAVASPDVGPTLEAVAAN